MLSIAPFSTPGRFWRGNLHTHSTRSDGLLAPEAVVNAYKGAGYDFLQLSDHFVSRLWLADHRYAPLSLELLHDADRRRNSRDGHFGRRTLAYPGGRAAG